MIGYAYEDIGIASLTTLNEAQLDEIVLISNTEEE